MVQPPLVASVEPGSGPAGALMVFIGADFNRVQRVQLGTVIARHQAHSQTFMTAWVPEALPGTYNVQLFSMSGNPVVGTFTILAGQACERRAWLVYPGTGATLPLEEPGGQWVCPELDISYPMLREDTNNRPDSDGVLDLTRLMGSRPVSAHIMAGGGAMPLDAIARLFAPYMAPSIRPELRWTLDTPTDGNMERMITLRAADFSSPIVGPHTRDIHLAWLAPDPYIYNPEWKENFILPAMAGQAGTNIQVSSSGEGPILPVITLQGPITWPALTFSYRPPGETVDVSFLFRFLSTYTLAAGTSVIIDAAARTARLSTGARVEGQIDWTVSRWPVLYGGNVSTTVTISGTGTTLSTSRATVRWRDRYIAA